jgi:hypothetical protein
MVIPFFDFTKSANTNISPFLQAANQPSILNGWTNAWKVGALTSDTGYSRVSNQIQDNKTIYGLYDFTQEPGTQKVLATVDDATSDDTQLFYKTPTGDWTEITGAETAWANFATVKVEMVGFIGYCFFVGYSATDGFLPVASLTGTTFSSSTNVTDMPQAKYILRYRDRLYLLNVRYGGTTYPFRVVASSVPSAGAITWAVAGSPTSSTGGFIDVDFSLEITGGGENWDRMVVFTERSAYMYDQSSFKKVWDIGCSNHRTIKCHNAYMIWANADGVWVSTGGQPQNIGGDVIDFIRAGTPRNFFAEIVNEVYWLYVGNVTVNGVTYANLVLKFNINLSTWEWRELSDTMTIFARYNNSGKFRLYMGDTDGNVWDKGQYTDSTLVNTDRTVSGAGVAIPSNFELAPIILDGAEKWKAIKTLTAYAERAGGLTLYARVIDRNTRATTPYKPLGKLEKFINTFDVSTSSGAIIQIAGSLNTSQPYASFYGFTLDIEQESKQPRKAYK